MRHINAWRMTGAATRAGKGTAACTHAGKGKKMARRYKQIRYREDLTALRVRMGKSQLEIAGMLGISRSSLQKYEYGDRKPRHNVQAKIDALMMQYPA